MDFTSFSNFWNNYSTKILNENNNEDSFEDTVEIYNSLNKEEKKLLSGEDNSVHEDSPCTVFRKVYYTKKDHIPVGYIELDDTGKLYEDNEMKDVSVGIVIKKEFRGQGIAKYLIKKAFEWFKNSSYETMTYATRYGNITSEKLAKKCGFAYFWDDKKGKQKIFIITNTKWLDVLKNKI